MSPVRVGVVRGGPTPEHDVSVRSGQAVLDALAQCSDFEGVDIFIDTTGTWHLFGRPRSVGEVLMHCDVVIPTVHGTFGEDGQLSALLERYAVPYVGSSRVPSVLAFHKALARQLVKKTGIPVPATWRINDIARAEAVAALIRRLLAPPYVVKPARAGSSIGVRKVWTTEEMVEAIIEAHEVGGLPVLIEEWIEGIEATVAVLEGWGREGPVALPEVEIVPPEGAPLFTYEAKYSGATIERCPGSFTRDIKEQLASYACAVHQTLGLRHMSRADFIVHPQRGPVFLEVNTLPGLTDTSLFPRAAAAVGLSFPLLVHHLIQLVIAEKGLAQGVGVC